MKFSTLAKELNKALVTLKGAMDRKPTMPILGTVKLEVDESAGTLTLSATDLEVWLSLSIPASVDESGSVAVSMADLSKLARSFKGDMDFSIPEETLEGEAVAVSCGNSRATLVTYPLDDIPTRPSAPEVAIGDYPCNPTGPLESLRLALVAVLHAASRDVTRYNLNGVAVEVNPGPSVQCIATDGHRLAMADSGSIPLPWEGIRVLPLQAVNLLVRLLKGKGGESFSVGLRGFAEDSVLFFEGADFALVVRCLDGDFPQYQNVIPKSLAETVRVDRKALIEALKSVLPSANQRNHSVKVTLNGALNLDTDNGAGGSASASVEVGANRDHEGEKVFGLNGNYLADALSIFEGDELLIGLSEHYANLPITLREFGESEPLAVVMPMRL